MIICGFIFNNIVNNFIDSYLDIHVEIHRSSGGTFDEHLSQQTDQLRARLNQTEKELLSVLSNAGLIDIVAAKQTVVSEISRMQQLILDTELEINKQENIGGIERCESKLCSGINPI